MNDFPEVEVDETTVETMRENHRTLVDLQERLERATTYGERRRQT